LRNRAPAGTSRHAAVGDGNSAPVGGAGSSLKRTAASVGGQAPTPPPKKRVSAVSLQEVELAPAAATTSAVATVHTRRTPASANAANANSGFFAEMPAEGLRKPEDDNGVDDACTNGGADSGGRGTLVPEMMDATNGRGAQLRQVVRLAEAVGRTLPFEHINHFLRVLKKKMVERAQQEGVRIQIVKASTAGSQQQCSTQAQQSQPQLAIESQPQRAMAVASSTTTATVASVLPMNSTHLGAVSKASGRRHGVVGSKSGAVELQGADLHPGAVPKRHSVLAAKSKHAGAAPGKQTRPRKTSTQASQSIDFGADPLARDASPQRSPSPPDMSASPPDMSADSFHQAAAAEGNIPRKSEAAASAARAARSRALARKARRAAANGLEGSPRSSDGQSA